VVWQGSAGDRRPYADLTGLSEICLQVDRVNNSPKTQQSQGIDCRLKRTIAAKRSACKRGLGAVTCLHHAFDKPNAQRRKLQGIIAVKV
jgi:hypothetical protein